MGNEVNQNHGNFLEAVQEHIEERNGELRFKLSQEAIDALNKQQSFNNIPVSGSTVTAKTVDYAKLMEQLANPAESPATYDVVADEVHYKDLDDKNVVVPSTVAKVTNICTSQIDNADVTKLYGGCRFQKGKESADIKTAIRAESSISGLDMFTKAAATVSTDRVVKRTAMFDTGLSATIVQEDMRQLDYFRKLVVLTMRAKQAMVAEYLSSIQGSSESVKLAAYKNINRSTTDNIFDAAYAKTFGSVDPKDAAQAHSYFEAYHDYQDALMLEFPHAANAETIEFGISARKLSIKSSPVWTNMEKVRRVKQFSGGSFFVSNQVDLGILRIPTTGRIVAAHKDWVQDLTYASMIFIENEARLQAGYKIAIENPKLPEIPAVDNLEYYKLLNISINDQQNLVDQMIQKATSVANEVCKNRANRRTEDAFEAVQRMFDEGK